MAAKTFSKKEAISHGFKMTKKYFGVIFLIILIYAAFNIISGQLNSRSGSAISEVSVRDLYAQPAAADSFYGYLVEAGYISKYGFVQDKLQNITSASELSIPAGLEADRDKIFEFLNGFRYRLPFPRVIYFLLAIALWAVGIIIQIGLVKIAISFARDQEPAVSELFSNGSLFFKFILASICYGLAVLGGIILLIVPGIIFMIALGMYSYLVVDKKMGPLQSLRVSCALTKGVRWQLFCFGLLLILVNIGGLLCLVVGLLFTVPATVLAYAYVYDRLREQYEAAM